MAVIDIQGRTLSLQSPSNPINPNADVAIKAPVQVTTTANITLSGTQTIDGVTLNVNDRVLAKNQTDQTTNGIYSVQTGPWIRPLDGDDNSDWTTATMVPVANGTINSGTNWRLTAASPIVLGTTSMSFAQTLLPSPVNDTSTVVGNLAVFYTPDYFGNPGTAIVDRFNRIQVGEAALTSQDVVNPSILASTPSWADTLIGVQFIGLGQVSSVAGWGNAAFCGAARTSDYNTAFGTVGQSGGTAGANLCGYNDGNGIALGANIFGIRPAGITGATLGAQIDINTAGTTHDIDPQGTIANGVTIGALFTAGAYSGVATANGTCAILISTGTLKQFRKGIIVQNVGLDTSVGAGGGGVAMEVGRNMSFRVINSGGADTEWWGNASGLVVNSNGVFNGTLTVGEVAVSDGTLTLVGSTSGNVQLITSVTGNLLKITQPVQVGQAGGATGALTFAGGTSGSVQLSTAAASAGTLQFVSAGSWAANSGAGNTPSFTALSLPAGVAAASAEFLTLVDNNGTTVYVPCWHA